MITKENNRFRVMQGKNILQISIFDRIFLLSMDNQELAAITIQTKYS